MCNVYRSLVGYCGERSGLKQRGVTHCLQCLFGVLFDGFLFEAYPKARIPFSRDSKDSQHEIRTSHSIEYIMQSSIDFHVALALLVSSVLSGNCQFHVQINSPWLRRMGCMVTSQQDFFD